MQTNILNEQDFYYANNRLGGYFMAKKKAKAVSKKPVKPVKTKKEGLEKISFTEIKENMTVAEKLSAYQHNIDMLTKVKNSMVISTPIDAKASVVIERASRLHVINEKIIFMLTTKAQHEIAEKMSTKNSTELSEPVQQQ